MTWRQYLDCIREAALASRHTRGLAWRVYEAELTRFTRRMMQVRSA